MSDISNVAVSSQNILQKQMDTISHNLANMSTVGYRAQNLTFLEQLNEVSSDKEGQRSAVKEGGTYYNTESGPLRYTGNPLDVALEGPGFLGVEKPGGGMAFIRSASMRMDDNGVLVTSAGIPVSANGGGPISIPSDATGISITKEGKILSNEGEIGSLHVVEFTEPEKLVSLGSGMYISELEELPPPAAPNTIVVGETVEGSNVNPIMEMTRMIDVSRSYQRTQQILSTDHDRLRQMIRRLTQQ